MTTTIMKDSVVGDAWIRQAMAQCPVQRIIDQKTGNFNGEILTGPVRLSWCDDLWELPAKKPGQMSEPKYGTSILFPPGQDFSIFYEEYYKQCGISFPEYFVNGQYHGLVSPFRDQAEKPQYNGYTPGSVFMGLTTKFKPSIVDARMNPIVDRSKVYPGVWAILACNVYEYGKNPPQPKKGVRFGLQTVMIIGDDTKLSGGGPDPSQQFKGVNVTAPIARPDMARMAGNAPPPPAGIPGYTAPGGMPPMPGAGAPIPQTHWTPPAPGGHMPPPNGLPPAPVYSAPTISPTEEEDLSFLS